MYWRNTAHTHLCVIETCVFTKHLNWECVYKQVKICCTHNISAFNKCLYAIRILFTPGLSLLSFMDLWAEVIIYVFNILNKRLTIKQKLFLGLVA